MPIVVTTYDASGNKADEEDFASLGTLKEVLSRTAKQDYIQEVVPKLEAGRTYVSASNGSSTDVYEVI